VKSRAVVLLYLKLASKGYCRRQKLEMPLLTGGSATGLLRNACRHAWQCSSDSERPGTVTSGVCYAGRPQAPQQRILQGPLRLDRGYFDDLTKPPSFMEQASNFLSATPSTLPTPCGWAQLLSFRAASDPMASWMLFQRPPSTEG